jgi:hypothetical protein
VDQEVIPVNHMLHKDREVALLVQEVSHQNTPMDNIHVKIVVLESIHLIIIVKIAILVLTL